MTPVIFAAAHQNASNRSGRSADPSAYEVDPRAWVRIGYGTHATPPTLIHHRAKRYTGRGPLVSFWRDQALEPEAQYRLAGASSAWLRWEFETGSVVTTRPVPTDDWTYGAAISLDELDGPDAPVVPTGVRLVADSRGWVVESWIGPAVAA